MSRTDIAAISSALRADMRLKTIYEIICNMEIPKPLFGWKMGRRKPVPLPIMPV